MYKLKLKEACKVSGLDLAAGQVIQTKNSALARELCDEDKAVLLRGKLKKVTPKEIEKDATKSPSIINTVDFKKLYKK